MLFLDGVYVDSAGSSTRFRWVKAPSNSELTQLSHTIAHRLARYLERQGLLERDIEHSTLALADSDEDPMDQLRGHSITSATAPASPKAPTFGALPSASMQSYRIAVGPQQGRKVFTLQTLPGIEESFSGSAGQAAGFSLYAGVATKAIACIEDAVVIKKILMHLEEKAPTQAALLLPDSRVPPQSSLFG